MLPHIFNGNGTISIMIDGKMKPVDTAHMNYEEIKQAIKEQNWDIIPKLVDIVKSVTDAINISTAKGSVTIQNGEVVYNGTVIHNSLTQRIVDMAKEGFDIGFMVKFLENLMQNPSFRAVNELYSFLEVGNIPITENGTFLTYKKVRSDWKDIHSGTFDNSIGAVCEMPRNKVDEDSSRTCSAGLHVCSYDYLRYFNSSDADRDRVIICEVNPADVVSIPQDYNNTKMRVCKYVVIGEVENYTQNELLADKAVMFTNEFNPNFNACDSSHSIFNFDNLRSSKEIGKKITNLLDEGTITDDDVVQAVSKCQNISDNFIIRLQDLVGSQNHKQIGKTIAYGIDYDIILSEDLFSHLFVDDCAYNSNDEEHYTCCERCDAELDVGDPHCSVCGFYNDIK